MDERTVGRAMWRFWSLGGEVRALAGATAVRNAAAPDHPLGTFLCELRTEEIAPLLAGPFRRVLVDPDTPPAAEAQLALHDWKLDVQLHLALPADAAVDPPASAARPVVDDAGWAEVRRLFRIDHLEEDARRGRSARSEAATTAAVAVRRGLGPGVTYLLAERSGEVAGCVATWPGEDGVGLVEDVFVHPGHRHRGVASELLRHAVTHARRRGAPCVAIGAEVGDTPKHLYNRFGFRPVAVARSYELTTGRGTA
ncbi:GNAT family N-acetyltransferase [Pseudonocardia adelaidensis]|uniref:N-acetyltransferase domain-containing protein n=1 Tax=Pseudonocardia adelaidensis TaxID=648754 RepID=A0ABP9NRI5_9PSEU